MPPAKDKAKDKAEAAERFRILCVGRAGAGKSSIVNRVTGLEGKKAADVQDWKVGEADINKEFTSIQKGGHEGFSVHDTEGFEPGDTKTYDSVHEFILKRHDESCPDGDRLDAVWLCAETPRAGGRVVEEGDVKLLQLAHQLQMPVVVIFTKYDLLIRSRKDELQEDKFSQDQAVLRTESREEAKKSLIKCTMSLEDTMKRMQTPMPSYVQVSTHPDYRDEVGLSSLIEVTRDLVRKKLSGKVPA